MGGTADARFGGVSRPKDDKKPREANADPITMLLAVIRNQLSGRIFITFCLCVANERNQACGPGEEGYGDLGSGVGGYPADGFVARFQQLTRIPPS